MYEFVAKILLRIHVYGLFQWEYKGKKIIELSVSKLLLQAIVLATVFNLCLLCGPAKSHGVLDGCGQIVTSSLREEEGEDTDDDGASAHDEEGQEVAGVTGRIEVSHGWGQQRPEPGQGGAHAYGDEHPQYYLLNMRNKYFCLGQTQNICSISCTVRH